MVFLQMGLGCPCVSVRGSQQGASLLLPARGQLARFRHGFGAVDTEQAGAGGTAQHLRGQDGLPGKEGPAQALAMHVPELSPTPYACRHAESIPVFELRSLSVWDSLYR